MKKSKFYIVVTVILLNILAFGCGKDKTVVNLSDESKTSGNVLSGDEIDTEQKQNSNDEKSDDSDSKLYIYVSGAVKNPGVYCVSSETRVYQVIELAGGMTEKACKDYLNLAEKVYDGQQIKVITKSQYKQLQTASGNVNETKASGDNSDSQGSVTGGDSLQVNINKATVQELTSLPGIGETKAKAIVTYREEQGSFSTIEDIKNVSGIGDSTFANIKAMITVN